jgi:hypothetical protein
MGNSEIKGEVQDFGEISKNLTEYLNLSKKDLKQILLKNRTLKSSFPESNLNNKLCSFEVLDLTMKITENLSTNNKDLHFLNTCFLPCGILNSTDGESVFISQQNNVLNQIISGEDIFKNNSSPTSKKENISIKLEDTNNNKKENISIKLEDTSNNKNTTIKLDESMRSSKLLKNHSSKKQEFKFDPQNKYNNLSQIQESVIKAKKEDFKTPDTSHDNNSLFIKNLDTIKTNPNDLINNKTKNYTIQQKKHIIPGKPISISPYKKKKKVNKLTKPAVVNIKVDLRDIQRENVIENYLNKSRINNSISPNKVNNYTTKSKSPDPRDSSFKVFIDRCTRANDMSIVSTKDSNVFDKKSDKKNYLNSSNLSNFKKTYTQRSINKTSIENSHYDNSSSSNIKPAFTKRETFGTDQRNVKKKDELEEKKPNIANLYREIQKLKNKENEENTENDKEKSPFEEDKVEEKVSYKILEKRADLKKNEIVAEKRGSNNRLESFIEEVKSYKQIEGDNESAINNNESMIEKMEINISASVPENKEEIQRKNSYKKPIIMEIKGPVYDNKINEEKIENKRYEGKEHSAITIEDLRKNINLNLNIEQEEKKEVYSKFKLSENLKKKENVVENNANQSKFKVNKRIEEKENEDEEEDEIMKYYRKKNKTILRNDTKEEEEPNNSNHSVSEKDEEEEEEDSYKFRSKNKIIYKNNTKKSKESNFAIETKRKVKGYMDKNSETNEESMNSIRNKGIVMNEKTNKGSSQIRIKRKQIYTSKNVDDNEFLNF